MENTIKKHSSKRLARILLAVPLILSIPLIAMQFDNGVNWDHTDFIVMGALLLIVGLTFEGIMRTVGDSSKRYVWIGILFFLFLYIWAELAVGIFNIPGISGS